MKRLLLTGSTLVCLAAGALATPALAGVPGNGLPGLDTSSQTEQVQYMMGGQRFCFYPGGWHGPGWYRCGFAWRRGLGWGGVYGWNGWDRGPRYGRGEGRGPRRDFGGDMRRGGRDDAMRDRGAGGRGFSNDRTGTVRGGGVGGPSAGGGSDGSGRSGLGGGRAPSVGGGGGGRGGDIGGGGMGGNAGGGRDQR